MSAQSQHGFRQFITDIATVLGLRPRRYVDHVYPFPAAPTNAAGKGYRLVQPTGGIPTITMQSAIAEEDLTVEQRNHIAAKNLSKEQISALSTVKDLTPDQLPAHVLNSVNSHQIPVASGILPGMNEVRRRLSAPKLQSIPTEKVSKPLWVEQLASQHRGIPPWMTEPTPPGQPKLPIERLPPVVPDTYLPAPGECLDPFLADRRSQALALTEEDLKPSLDEEDDDKTVTREAVKKERE